MKKVLLSTSAIVLAATSVQAAEWDVRVGGYHNQFIGYASSDQDNNPGADFDGVDVKQNAEIFFLPSITLDNGIKFGANVQLESGGATGTPDTIDESYLYVRGSFGEINLGSENSAGYKMHYAAPNRAIIGFNSPSTNVFIPWSGGGAGNGLFRSTLSSTYLENNRNNDADRITYYTPRFAGFQVGASYARDASQDSGAQVDVNAAGTTTDIFDIGANYVNDFGGVNVAVSARYGIATIVGGGDPTVLGFGANIGFGGFTIGGSWAEQNDSGNADGTAFDVGVAYDTGPWGFSAMWFHGENVDDDQGFATGLDEEQDTFGIGINYKLAKGVRLNGFAAYVDFSEDDTAVATNRDTDGFVIGTGIGLSF
ncbi:MAG: porin [Pseudomonadota bacterium]